jgi:hypothetical protein
MGKGIKLQLTESLISGLGVPWGSQVRFFRSSFVGSMFIRDCPEINTQGRRRENNGAEREVKCNIGRTASDESPGTSGRRWPVRALQWVLPMMCSHCPHVWVSLGRQLSVS